MKICKPSLEKLIFDDILFRPISASEMNAISFALYKEATRPLEDGEFFEVAQFYVRGILNDIDEDALVSFRHIHGFFLLTSFSSLFLIRCYFDQVVKREVLHEYILPMEGHSRLCAIGTIEVFGSYEIIEENDINFSGNWPLFCQVAQFHRGDLFAIKVQVRPQYIKLFFEWVGFRHV